MPDWLRLRWVRYLSLFGVGAIAVFALELPDVQALLQSALVWVDSLGLWAPLAFILIYNLATIFFLPGSLLTLGGGVLFGLVRGSLYVFVAATLGATCAFLIGRYLTRPWVEHQLAERPKFRAISQAVAQEGFKIVLLTRLSPIFPFNLLNYAFGVTQVSLRDYVLGSVGMIPGTIFYVYLGSLIGNLADLGRASSAPSTPYLWAVRLVGLLATFGFTIYITRLARRALQNSIADAADP
jgi:uncharacterized membrane protein YdjX (TVP38/TMEM64 family)